MERHFRLLVEQRGEQLRLPDVPQGGELVLRVLKPGREIQQTLMMLESVAEFERIVERLRRSGVSHRRGMAAGA